MKVWSLPAERVRRNDRLRPETDLADWAPKLARLQRSHRSAFLIPALHPVRRRNRSQKEELCHTLQQPLTSAYGLVRTPGWPLLFAPINTHRCAYSTIAACTNPLSAGARLPAGHAHQ